MAEDLVELCFEGLDFVTDRYHDAIYDRFPALKRGKWRIGNAAAKIDEKQQQEDRDARSRSREPPHTPSADTHLLPPPPRDGQALERDYSASRRYADEDYARGRRRHSVNVAPAAAVLRGYYNDDYYGDYYHYPPPPPPYAPQQRSAPRSGRSQQPRSSSSRYKPRARSLPPSRSPSPSSDKQREKDSSVGFASTVVGALAGGLVGNELGKGDTFTALASAVIGAVGAKELEKKWERKNRKDSKRQERWEDKWGEDGREVRRDELMREYGGGRWGFYDEDDERWERERRRRRRRSR